MAAVSIKNLELYTALTGSKAIRDEGSFVIFTADAMSAQVVQEHKGTLIKIIENYGLTICTEVDCYYDL